MIAGEPPGGGYSLKTLGVRQAGPVPGRATRPRRVLAVDRDKIWLVRFYADLHIHSKYSRACSKDCDLEHLAWWARRKGIMVIGTGDFTHPAWYEHLRENLVPAEPGLYKLRDDLDRQILRTLPPTCRTPVRFMLSVEVSTIYKRGDKTRKVHHLIYVPDLDTAAAINRRLERIGNIRSDGRPILGLDSRDLLEITLESGEASYLVPAHIWTPWFAVLGSKSGFDAVADCYADLADHIFALETGLSSDPEMNWRLSALDRYRLVSNSDAHSPPMLGREACVFDTELDYFAMRRALQTGEGYGGTVEFFPEEGKYHLDGHRKCDVRLEPAETRRYGGRCPVCGKPLTVGVLARVEELADRPAGVRPEGAADYRSLVPLPEIVSELLDVGPKSKAVLGEVADLVAKLGPELGILNEVPLDEIGRAGSPLLAEAIDRLRRGQVIREAGYDGEYGVIRLFEPGELESPGTVPTLFDPAGLVAERPGKRQRKKAAAQDPPPLTPELESGTESAATPAAGDGTLLGALDPDQRAAASVTSGPLLIIAGPGTGKTRTLTHRIAHLVATGTARPEECLAVTFTRRAAQEMQERLAALVPDAADRITVTTFHGLGLRIVREQAARLGLGETVGIADEAGRLALLADLLGENRRSEARKALEAVSAAKRARALGEAPPPDAAELLDQYDKALRARDQVDFDDLITIPVRLLGSDLELAAAYRARYPWISVDEYQDVDELQYRLLRLLTAPDANLCAIGDPDQAIYRFRGADVGFFLRFQQDFPTARVVQLTRNYRSAARIVAGALQAIAPTTLVRDRRLEAVRADDQHTVVGRYEAANEQDEAEFVVRTIDALLGGSSFHSFDSGAVETFAGHGRLSFADIAVLYRTDAQAQPLLEAFARAGMPCEKRAHTRLTDRLEITELARRVGEVYASSPGPVTGALRTAVQLAIDDTEVSLAWADTPTEERVSRLRAAADLLAPLAERCGTDLDRFQAELALGVEIDTWDPRADRISLLTLHAAKGLEFPVVFLVGCEDGLLPLRWPGSAGSPNEQDEEEIREERRLFFVGMTRAQSCLYLSYARERTRQGTRRAVQPSPFLRAIDTSLVTPLGSAREKPRNRVRQLRLL